MPAASVSVFGGLRGESLNLNRAVSQKILMDRLIRGDKENAKVPLS